MSQSPGNSRRIIVGSLIFLLLLPPCVFGMHGILGGLSVSETLAALFDQYTADRANLVIVTLLGILPLLLLVLIFWIRRRFWKTRDSEHAYAVGGVLPIVAVALLSNHEYWSVFLPSREFPGFPHGLEFIIGAFIFAPIGVAVGIAVSWLLLRGSRGG